MAANKHHKVNYTVRKSLGRKKMAAGGCPATYPIVLLEVLIVVIRVQIFIIGWEDWDHL